MSEFEKLLPFKWRDTEVPVSSVRLSLAHDLVEHKYWGRDGARIEATGLAPIRISARIPLGNHIYPGKSESWKQGKLYPTVFRQLLIDFAKRTDGLLQHPEFGLINCKAERLDCDLDASKRDSTEVEASWVQSSLASVVSSGTSPVADLTQAAGDLDASDVDLRALAPQIPKYQASLTDLARAVQSVGDQTSILQQRAGGQIAAIVYRATEIQRSIDRARDARTWRATQAIERIKEASFGLREALLQAGRDIGIQLVTVDTTLAGLAAQLPANTNMNDVIRLNPRLVARPVILAGTGVRYFIAA